MNAKDITSARSNVLFIGDAGTHKTFALGGVPGIKIFDFDAGMAINRGRDINYEIYKDLTRYDVDGRSKLIASPEDNAMGLYTFGEGWDAFYKDILGTGRLIKSKDPKAPKAIGLDSLTMMSMIAVNKILKDTGHAMPHQGTWGAHHEYFKTIFSMITAWPIRLWATAHVQRNENDLTQNVEKLPLLAGKLAGLIPIFFDEVYFCESEVQTDGTQKFTIRTKATSILRQAKSRFGVPDGTETNFAAIEKFLSLKPINP